MVGEHNVLNALAAVAVALQLGFTPSDAVSALSTMTGMFRRVSSRIWRARNSLPSITGIIMSSRIRSGGLFVRR